MEFRRVVSVDGVSEVTCMQLVILTPKSSFYLQYLAKVNILITERFVILLTVFTRGKDVSFVVRVNQSVRSVEKTFYSKIKISKRISHLFFSNEGLSKVLRVYLR